MPTVRTVRRWLVEAGAESSNIPSTFAEAYDRAKHDQFQVREDELIEIADDARNDWMDRETERGVLRVVDHEHIQRSKLRIDARLWLLAKLQPQKYGDRLAHQMLGADGKPSAPRLIVVLDPDQDK